MKLLASLLLFCVIVPACCIAEEYRLLDAPPAEPVTAYELFERPRAAETPREQPQRILLFTAEWCEPCQQLKTAWLPALQKLQWRIGSGPDNDIQIIDYDTHRELTRQYGVTELPTLVFIGKPGVIRCVTQPARFTPPMLRQSWRDFYGW